MPRSAIPYWTTSWEVARITRGQITLLRQLLDLRDGVEASVWAAIPSADARHQQVSVSLPLDPVCVEADRDRLTPVMGNLLNNAIKVHARGAVISGSASNTPKAGDRARAG